jgi:hypothetical protein
MGRIIIGLLALAIFVIGAGIVATQLANIEASAAKTILTIGLPAAGIFDLVVIILFIVGIIRGK